VKGGKGARLKGWKAEATREKGKGIRQKGSRAAWEQGKAERQ
jgi:hypothetical protein